MSLSDKVFRIFRAWTECAKCVGQPLGPEASSARVFLFVFALKPQDSDLPACCESNATETVFAADMSERAGQALMVSHVDVVEPEPKPAYVQLLSPSIADSDSEYFNCAKPDSGNFPLDHHVRLPVCDQGHGGGSSLRPCGAPLGGDLFEWSGADLALCDVPQYLQEVSRPHCNVDSKHRSTDLHSSQGLRVHCGSGPDFRCSQLGQRRLGPRGWRRRPVAKERGRQVPLRRPEGCDAAGCSAPEGVAPITNGEVAQQCGSDSEGSGHSDGRSSAGSSKGSSCPCGNWRLPYRQSGNGDQLSACSSPSSIDSRPQHDHGGSARHDQPGVWGTAESFGPRCGDGEVADRPSCGDDLAIDGNFGAKHGKKNRVRPRFLGWLGASVAALVSASSADLMVPPKHLQADHVTDAGQGFSGWPRLSPEVSVEVPVDPGLQLLPSAWKASEPLDMTKRASRAQLKQWLGPQSWKIDRGSRVGLIEVYTGRGRLSDAHEDLCHESEAIRLGYMYGQELRSDKGRWFTLSLIDLCRPDDVYVSFPCKGWCRWSSFNERRGPLTRRMVLRERCEGRKDLDLLSKIVERQALGQRHTHAENPQSSLAWSEKVFDQVPVPHAFVTFDQCALNLKHPESGRPIRKSTTLFTTRRCLAQHVSQFKCSCSVKHDRAEGTFRGRAVTSWCEDYSRGLAEALIYGMKPDLKSEEVFFASTHYDEHVKLNPVEQCYVGTDDVIHKAYPAENAPSGEPQVQTHDTAAGSTQSQSVGAADTTVFKVTDVQMSKQLSLLQFPGRYPKLDLPVPVQTQLQAWSGLDVSTVVTASRVKCYVNPPAGVVAARRTTLARSGGEWYYVEFRQKIGTSKRKVRLPLNASAVVTFFGEMPQNLEVPPPAETAP